MIFLSANFHSNAAIFNHLIHSFVPMAVTPHTNGILNFTQLFSHFSFISLNSLIVGYMFLIYSIVCSRVNSFISIASGYTIFLTSSFHSKINILLFHLIHSFVPIEVTQPTHGILNLCQLFFHDILISSNFSTVGYLLFIYSIVCSRVNSSISIALGYTIFLIASFHSITYILIHSIHNFLPIAVTNHTQGILNLFQPAPIFILSNSHTVGYLDLIYSSTSIALNSFISSTSGYTSLLTANFQAECFIASQLIHSFVHIAIIPPAHGILKLAQLFSHCIFISSNFSAVGYCFLIYSTIAAALHALSSASGYTIFLTASFQTEASILTHSIHNFLPIAVTNHIQGILKFFQPFSHSIFISSNFSAVGYCFLIYSITSAALNSFISSASGYTSFLTANFQAKVCIWTHCIHNFFPMTLIAPTQRILNLFQQSESISSNFFTVGYLFLIYSTICAALKFFISSASGYTSFLIASLHSEV